MNPVQITDPDLDISARAFWAQPFEERERAFARLRREAPLAYHRAYESTLKPPDGNTPGFWSVTRHDDCRTVSRNAGVWSTTRGVFMEEFPEVIVAASHSFLAMDGEEHDQVRGIVSDAFKPSNVRKIESWIDQHVTELVGEMIEKGEGDFCELFAKQLPGRIFAHLYGVDPDSEEAHTIVDASEKMLAWDDPDCAQGRDGVVVFAEEAERIQDVTLEVAEQRRSQPRDDLVSWVVQAEFEGRRLEDFEIAAFFIMLGSAANDTTRHSTAHAVRLLSEHPDQRQLLLSDPDTYVRPCIEEVLRYATPVMHFCRSALEDTELRGSPIAAGERIVMWYCSGNRDETAFDDPGRFDITRSPNPHLAFGAGGPHFCIGATLGRKMLSAALGELYTRMPDLTVAGEPVYQVNNFLHGVARLPVRWTR